MLKSKVTGVRLIIIIVQIIIIIRTNIIVESGVTLLGVLFSIFTEPRIA